MIEDVIYKAIKQSSAATKLTLYNNIPAIFYQTAPHDKDKKWGVRQFPRVNFSVDWTYNAERKTAGTMVVDVWCTNETLQPENIADNIVSDISDTFVSDNTGTFCMAWNRTDYFDGAENKEPKTVGATLFFDILAFSTSGALAPVETIQRFIKDMQPHCIIIGKDILPEIYKPTEYNPVVYARLNSMNGRNKNTYAVQWFDATLGIHIITPKPEDRLQWIMAIMQDFCREGDYFMANGTTMRFINVSGNPAANPLQAGQITLNTQYGVLTVEPESELLNHAIF